MQFISSFFPCLPLSSLAFLASFPSKSQWYTRMPLLVPMPHIGRLNLQQLPRQGDLAARHIGQLTLEQALCNEILEPGRYLGKQLVSFSAGNSVIQRQQSSRCMEEFRKNPRFLEKFWDCKFSSQLVQYRFHLSVSGPDVTHTSSESVPSVNTRNQFLRQVGSTCKHLPFSESGPGVTLER